MKIVKFFYKIFLMLFSKQTAEVASAFLDIAEKITSKTKTNIDDKALAYISTYIAWRLKDLDSVSKAEVQNLINANKGKYLKDYEVSLKSKDGLALKTPIGNVGYNWKDGSFSFGKKFEL